MTDVLRDPRAQQLLLVAVVIAMFMDGMDGSIVNVALPVIAGSMGVGTSTVSWVVTIYFLMMAGLILIFGKIADGGHLKKVFICGFLIFSVSSLMCGISTGLDTLLIGRAIQGIGASMLAASAMMMCVKYYPASRMGYALSITVLGASIGTVLGPTLGGVLTEVLSWHWIFLINVPIGLVAAIFSMKAIPADRRSEKREPFDLVGAAILFVSLSCGLYVVETLPSTGFGVSSMMLTAICLIGLVALVFWERRCEHPVILLSLFRIRDFVFVLVAYLLINLILMGILYLLPFYLSKGMGFDSMVTGLYLLIPSAVTLVICTKASKISDKIGRRPFVLVACAAMLLMTAILSVITPDMGLWMLIVALLCFGLVWGVCGGPASSRIVENSPKESHGYASSLMSFSIYFAAALGTAVFSALFAAGSGLGMIDFSTMPLDGFLSGFHLAALAGILLSVLALLLSAVVNEKKNGHGISKED